MPSAVTLLRTLHFINASTAWLSNKIARSDLIKRVYQHKNGLTPGFSLRYDCKQLVYYEIYEGMMSTIEREKQIKGGSRKKKIVLIESMNPKNYRANKK